MIVDFVMLLGKCFDLVFLVTGQRLATECGVEIFWSGGGVPSADNYPAFWRRGCLSPTASVGFQRNNGLRHAA